MIAFVADAAAAAIANLGFEVGDVVTGFDGATFTVEYAGVTYRFDVAVEEEE